MQVSLSQQGATCEADGNGVPGRCCPGERAWKKSAVASASASDAPPWFPWSSPLTVRYMYALYRVTIRVRASTKLLRALHHLHSPKNSAVASASACDAPPCPPWSATQGSHEAWTPGLRSTCVRATDAAVVGSVSSRPADVWDPHRADTGSATEQTDSLFLSLSLPRLATCLALHCKSLK